MTTEPGAEIPSSAEDAFAEFIARREAAEAAGTMAPKLEEWVARYPQYAESLRQLESDWRGFDVLFRGAFGAAPAETIFHRTPYASDSAQAFVEFSPGRVVGDYRLVARIGQGGMGEVWEAEQLSLRRPVALKFIRPDRLSPRSLAYFDREARAGGRLNHPAIVTVHATGREGDLHWIAQELVAGSSSLHDFVKSIKSTDAFPHGYFDRVALFMAELCDALQVAHEAGVIHRDIKPHNILVARDDHPKLTDFGLARLTDEEAFSGSYGVKGTPIYMSPEQILGKTKLIDHRTDIYSTGAVLFELLTLQRPFEIDSSRSLAQVLSQEAPDPRTLCRDVPAELGAIALRALEHRPSERYSTAAKMADDLRRYLHHEPVLARPPGPLRRAQKWIRRHPTAASVMALGVLLAGITYTLRDQVQRANERSDAAEKAAVLTRAWRAIDIGDMQGAASEIGQFNARFPDDPQGHLVMLTGFAGSSMFSEMEAEIGKLGAFEGLNDSLDDQSAMGLFIQGMRWQALEGSAAYPRVQVNIERALELDPKFEVAYFPLYQVRKAQGDFAGARQALESYRGTLRTSAPAVRLVDALLSEIDRDLEGALGQLDDLRSEVGDEEFLRLRGFQALGRVALLLYQADPRENWSRLDQAEAALTRATESLAGDSGASVWANLGLVHLRRQARTPSAEQRDARVASAMECGRRAVEIDPRDPKAWQVLVAAGMCALDLTSDPDEQAQVLARLRTDMAALEALDSNDPALRAVQGDLLYREGMAALRPSDPEPAYRLFEASCERSASQLNSRVMLAQVDFMQGRHEKALAELRKAQETWNLLEAQGANHPTRWLFAIQVWGVGCADQAGQLDLAFEYAEKARAQLASGDEVSLSEVMTLAEFLATPDHEVLKDCSYVNQLFDDYPLEEAFGADYQEVIEKVRAACPRSR